MEHFAAQTLRLGCMKGFRHFSFYLRGKEELLVVVKSAAAGSDGEGGDGSGSEAQLAARRGLPPASPAAREVQQVRLSCPTTTTPPPHAVCGSGALSDTAGGAQAGTDETVFLLAGYDKYQRPYVWLRSASPVLQLSESAEDMPLSLKTTERWPQSDPPSVTIWEIVAELVSLCVVPAPPNPFELDPSSLEGAWSGPPVEDLRSPQAASSTPPRGPVDAAGMGLSELERTLNYVRTRAEHRLAVLPGALSDAAMSCLVCGCCGCQGAVAALLHEIFLSDAPFAALGPPHPKPPAPGSATGGLSVACTAVADDMKRCTERHFRAMGSLLPAS